MRMSRWRQVRFGTRWLRWACLEGERSKVLVNVMEEIGSRAGREENTAGVLESKSRTGTWRKLRDPPLLAWGSGGELGWCDLKNYRERGQVRQPLRSTVGFTKVSVGKTVKRGKECQESHIYQYLKPGPTCTFYADVSSSEIHRY